jgi:hypothetical protein
MPGGGLLSLIAFGAQNVLLSGNPDMTYFYRVFKKYTHFSLETTTKLMDGPTDYPYDRTIQLKARVDRVGDLLTDMYFSFQVPAIFSKKKAGTGTGIGTQYEFQWVRYLGAAAIQSVSITVGPDKVQEFTGEYLMAKALIDYPVDKFEKWQELVGDTDTFTNPAAGPYGTLTDSGTLYPTVYEDIRNPGMAQNNTPSIPSATIYVPLPFWFTEEGQALPMIALQYYTVDVTINLTPSQQLYTILSTLNDQSAVRMAPGYAVTSTATQFQETPNIPELGDVSDAATSIRNFLVDINYTTPALNSWPCSPTIHTTYAFLPQKERDIFSSSPLSYVVRETTLIPFPTILSNQVLDLYIHNPITRLLFVPRRSDILMYRNAWGNFTNWWDWPKRPRVPADIPGSGNVTEKQSATGILVPNAQEDIIRALRILVDGNEIQEMKPTSFYTKIVPYRYLDGASNRKLPVYSFELHSPTSQPAGSINASRIRNFQVDLQVYPLPPNSTYFYSLNVYAEALNFFLVESGMGRMKYAN